MNTYDKLKDQFAAKASDEAGFAIAYALLELAEAQRSMTSVIGSLSDDLRSDHPLQGQTFEGLEQALNRIAEAIENDGNSAASTTATPTSFALDDYRAVALGESRGLVAQQKGPAKAV